MMGKSIKSLVYIILIFLCITMFISFFMAIQAKMFSGKMSGIMGYKVVANLSEKMEPLIKRGDLVIVKETEAKNISTGDVIAYRKEDGGALIQRVSSVHIMSISGYHILSTKGDAEKAGTSVLITDNVLLGSMLFSIPFIGYLVYFWASIPGIIFLISLIIIFLIISVSKSISRKRLSERREILKGKVYGG